MNPPARRLIRLFLISFGVLLSLALSTGSQHQRAIRSSRSLPSVPFAASRDGQTALSTLPLLFEANRGQTAPRARFLARGHGYTLFLAKREIVFAFAGESGGARVLRMRWPGANTEPQVVGRNELPGKSNYFLGNDPRRWHTNVPLFTRVEYPGIRSGLDLAFYGNSGQLEFDAVVAPRADPRRASFLIQGADKLVLDGQGNLLIRLGGNTLTFLKPLIYQLMGAARKPVEGSFLLRGQHSVGFRVGPYDHNLPLIIDPALVYSTFLGGSDDDSAAGVAADSTGHVYIAGSTKSADFPTKPALTKPGGAGNYDLFVAKLDTTQSGAASLVYSTYLGGSNDDRAFGIALDSDGDAVIAGVTSSPNFPTMNAFKNGFSGPSDITVTKLDPTGGNLIFSTYFGGSSTEGTANSGGVAVDSSKNIYVTSDTESVDLFTTTGALQRNLSGTSDAFVAKFSPTGSVLYATYLGGTGAEAGTGVAVDGVGTIYVSGYTSSNDFSPKNQCVTLPSAFAGGASDGFLARLDPTGSGPAQLLYLVLLGGSDQDQALAVAVDSASPANAYVTGTTRSSDFPVTTANAFQSSTQGGLDAFVSMLTLGGNGLVCATYSSYLGGATGDDSGRGIAVNSLGEIYVTGQTASSDFPKQNPIQATIGGPQDAFVAKLDPAASGAASLLYSTFLGGVNSDSGAAIALDNQGNAYVVGATISPDFPITQANAFQPACKSCSGSSPFADAFLAKISDAGAVPAASFTPAQLIFGNANVGSSSFPLNVALSNAGNATLAISQIALTGSADFSQTNNCPSSLAGGAAPCGISVTFTPTAPAAETAAITIFDNAAGSPQSVPITGTGVAPVADLSLSSIDFGSQPQGESSNAIPITLTNGGNAPLSISSINITGANASDFSPTSDNCAVAPGTLPGGSSCVVSVVFTPTATGPRIAQLNFADNSLNSANSTQVVALSGIGIPPAPIASLLPGSHDFGGVNVGSTSSATTITLVNSGNLALHIVNIQITGNSDFAFATAQSPACTLAAASQLAARTSCNMAVIFKPSAMGAESAQIVVTDDSGNIAGSMQTATLTGIGAAPLANVSPASLTLAGQLAGTTSPGTPVALKNTGMGPLSYVVSFTGANASDFSEKDACAGNVNAGATCSLMVMITPAATGARSATMVITDNSGGVANSQQTVAVSATGTDFSIQAASGDSASATISAGESAAYNLQIIPVDGFIGPLSLACTGAPPLSSCSPSPGSVTVASASPVGFQVLVPTTAFLPPLAAPKIMPLVFLLLLVLGSLSLSAEMRQRKLAPLCATALLLFLLLAGCGGLGGSANPATGTPAGTYTLVITGTQIGGSRSLNLTLQVK